MCYFQFQCVKYYLIITAFISLIIVYCISKRILTIINNMFGTDELSDDEVYFGKLTLKELKKHILWDKQQSVSAINSPNNSGDNNESFKILQAHSQPNLINKTESSTLDLSELNSSEWDMKGNEDSFIKMENMVAKLCLSPRRSANPGELNNTLEVIEYILNNPPSSTKETEKTDDLTLKTKFKNEPTVSDSSPKKMLTGGKKHEACNSAVHPQNTPIIPAHQLHKNTETSTTPREIKQKLLFKTPSQPPSLKKPSTLKKTPSRCNAYQHISSPVASYIKNCPIAPLVKDVHPKKPLPGTSSIPKFVKTVPPAQPSNKENINLPPIAYKSAKKTRVINVPDEQRLPQSHWIKKVTTPLPRPLVMKHDHRELNCAKKLSQQESSFADLSYHQAEVSVCTQKSAFKAKKNV